MNSEVEDKTIAWIRTLDSNTGEIVKEDRTVLFGKQPDYYKVYISHILEWQHVGKSISPILHSMLARMTFAKVTEPGGGQIIILNSYMKKIISSECNVTVSRVDQAIRELVKADILKKVDRGTYQVNPKYFGKGDWPDVRHLRATFDYNKGTVETEIEYKDEGE